MMPEKKIDSSMDEELRALIALAERLPLEKLPLHLPQPQQYPTWPWEVPQVPTVTTDTTILQPNL